MHLPIVFQENMKKLLQEEWHEFLDAMNAAPLHGLRVNTLKISVEDFIKKSPFKLKPIPWSRDGFFISKDERPGIHPYYHAGLYYIQEPSAMLPAEILDVKPGEKVLDICAAPGGKSAQIAAHLGGRGILVTNDINAERTKPLARNIARLGVDNAVILNDSPQSLARNFINWFDAILIDAPCSGEGMFRRDEQAPKSWEEFGAAYCIPLQEEILENAAKMLKPGGRMVYSTCTFAPDENECVIARFIESHPEFELLPITKKAGLENGRPEWGGGSPKLAYTLRAWPHKTQGEGHFAALLQKKTNQTTIKEQEPWKARKPKELDLWEAFKDKYLTKAYKGNYITFGEHLYLIHPELPNLTGLKVIRPGLYLGEFKKNRFEPAHALAMSLNASNVLNAVAYQPDDGRLERYFKGETLNAEVPNGWVLFTVDTYGVGWAKAVNGILKNHYPRGWRKL